MRLGVCLLSLGLVLSAACSGDDPEDHGGGDAGAAPDAAAADAGASGPEVPCGASTCSGATAYCREAPTGPCEARDGGACGSDEEVCNLGSLATGCTPAIPRACAPLPDGCTNCVCLIDTAPCGGGGMAVTCSGTAQLGLTLRCPPP